ncbi:LPS translocon maturation chaperone LptM [Stutzerimonas azotifigens]|nr:lipoprotein [Stutzerimonas azotifigens]
MKRLLLPLFALALLAAGLSGCGQKGPLYLPDDEKAAQQHSKDRYEL